MGVTRLKRKDRRNKNVASARQQKIKLLTAKPVIKKVDIEELKKQFVTEEAVTPAVDKSPKKKVVKEEVVAEVAPVTASVEESAVVVEEAPTAEAASEKAE